MAGNKLSKLKTLAIYDYFLHNVSGSSSNSTTSTEELRVMLKRMFGDDFERKSIYSDIDSINEYIAYKRKYNKKEADLDTEFQWIDRTGNSYFRNFTETDFKADEIGLIYDAINATSIANNKVADKFRNYWPAYLEDYDESAYISVERKTTMVFDTMMKKIKYGIQKKCALKINYGYKLNDDDPRHVCVEERHISPVVLYYEGNACYLFAIDNHRYVEAGQQGLTGDDAARFALRQFRIDRIDTSVEKRPYEKYYSCDKKIVENKISGAVKAYSTGDSITLIMTIQGYPKTVIKAFDYLKHEIYV